MFIWVESPVYVKTSPAFVALQILTISKHPLLSSANKFSSSIWSTHKLVDRDPKSRIPNCVCSSRKIDYTKLFRYFVYYSKYIFFAVQLTPFYRLSNVFTNNRFESILLRLAFNLMLSAPNPAFWST